MKDKAAEREWQKALDDHAAHVMHGVITYCADVLASARDAGMYGGRPTIEICGPDGVWRRYYVRLTGAGPVLP